MTFELSTRVGLKAPKDHVSGKYPDPSGGFRGRGIWTNEQHSGAPTGLFPGGS